MLLFVALLVIEAFLLVAARSVVRGISLDKSVTEDQMITIRRQNNAVGVDFSADDRYVYWSDVNADKISRVFLNGSGYEVIVSEGNSISVAETLSDYYTI